jgi:hypothetical protein
LTTPKLSLFLVIGPIKKRPKWLKSYAIYTFFSPISEKYCLNGSFSGHLDYISDSD